MSLCASSWLIERDGNAVAKDDSVFIGRNIVVGSSCGSPIRVSRLTPLGDLGIQAAHALAQVGTDSAVSHTGKFSLRRTCITNRTCPWIRTTWPTLDGSRELLRLHMGAGTGPVKQEWKWDRRLEDSTDI